MIRAVSDAAGTCVTGSLPPGSAAYVDAEWIRPDHTGPCPGIVITPDGLIRYGSDSVHRSRHEPDVSAALALVRVARDAVHAVADAATVQVTGGRGAISLLVRELTPVADNADVCDAIVETTGDADALVSACGRVSNLGTIVLAGEAAGRQVDLDFYWDVHRRGLRLVGVAPPLGDGALEELDIPDWLIGSVCSVRAGDDLPGDAPWYRITW